MSVIAAALITTLASAPAMADGGTITVRGNISKTTCTLTGADGSTGGDQTVTLPGIARSALAADGATAGEKSFYFQLSGADCLGGTARLHFDRSGNPGVDPVTGYLKHTGTPGVAGVQVQLLNSTGAVINLADSSNSLPVTLAAGSTPRIELVARYVRTGAITEGDFSSAVAYVMDYH